jgi:hypothetical protein
VRSIDIKLKDVVWYSIIYISSRVQHSVLQNDKTSVPIIRFSEFLGIGYFGDKKQRVIAPIFDLRHNAERGWEKVMASQQQEVPIFHAVFVEHPAKYEFIAHPIEMAQERINHVLYRSFSSLSSMNKFKSDYNGLAYIKFGWYDLTKPQKFDVLPQYAAVDSVEFKNADDIKPGTLIDQIRKS